MALEIITAESKPVYCICCGSDCWTCLDLVQWHKLMVKKFGKTEANLKFMQSWENDTPYINKTADCRSFDSTFREYFKSVGLLGSLYSGIGVIAQPIGFATDVIGNTADAVTNTTKVLKWLVPTLTVLAAVVVIVSVTMIVKNLRPV